MFVRETTPNCQQGGCAAHQLNKKPLDPFNPDVPLRTFLGDFNPLLLTIGEELFLEAQGELRRRCTSLHQKPRIFRSIAVPDNATPWFLALLFFVINIVETRGAVFFLDVCAFVISYKKCI